jgi:opacity protein-like surface antigen
MRLISFLLVATLLCLVSISANAQDDERWLFNIGGGPGFPLGDMSKFVDTGGHFVVGAGYNFSHIVGVDTEFMWQDLPVNSSTRHLLGTSGASARQYAWTFNPIIHVPLGEHFGTYLIGGIGWYHRSGETTTPGAGVVCDPYWSWWYGCTIGSVDFVTGSRSADSFGENIGAGLTLRLGESHAKFYTEIRYHHAGYNKVSTQTLPLTFGLRW